LDWNQFLLEFGNIYSFFVCLLKGVALITSNVLGLRIQARCHLDGETVKEAIKTLNIELCGIFDQLHDFGFTSSLYPPPVLV
jgi:hypothetical protein